MVFIFYMFCWRIGWLKFNFVDIVAFFVIKMRVTGYMMVLFLAAEQT